MALKDDLLSLVDELRAIAGDLGFRPYQVWVRTTQSAGTRPGIGTKVLSETRLLVGGQNPKVREVKRRDIVAGSNNLLTAEYDIGPLTPEFGGGGISHDTISPQRSSTPTEVWFLLKGPGFPATGLLCQRIGDHVDRPLRIVIRVRSTGRAG